MNAKEQTNLLQNDREGGRLMNKALGFSQGWGFKTTHEKFSGFLSTWINTSKFAREEQPDNFPPLYLPAG